MSRPYSRKRSASPTRPFSSASTTTRPIPERKFLDQVQTVYPRKNWSSVMLMNGSRCKALTPGYVNSASGLELHRFNWLKDEEIGELALEWNWLVGEYSYDPNAKIVHFTRGGPYFEEFRSCDYADEWLAEFEAMKFVGTR